MRDFSRLSFRKRLAVGLAAGVVLAGLAATGSVLAGNPLTGPPDPNGFVAGIFYGPVTPNPTNVARSYQEWQDLLNHQDPSDQPAPANH